MIFGADQFDLAEIKKALRVAFPRVPSSHLSEAIAMGLGYGTSRAMHADFRKASEAVNRPIREAAFSERLFELAHIQVTGEPLTAALVRAIPAGLSGENQDERLIVAVARELFQERENLECIDGAHQDQGNCIWNPNDRTPYSPWLRP